MTQPSSVPPPPPPAYGGPPPAYGYPPPAPPPGYVLARGSGGPPSGGRVSPLRLILVFVVVLAIGLAAGAAVVLALQPPAKAPDCPDPSVPCGAPPIAPTLPPVAVASPTPRPSPAATIVRPSGPLVISSARPSIAPTVAPTSTVVPSTGPSTPPSAPPSASASAPPEPSPTPPVALLPQPRPASNAAPLRIGEVWISTGMGFQLEYNSNLWVVEDQSANSLSLSAGKGAVLVSIEGFKSSSSLKSLIQQKINKLTDVILGLTEETASWRQPPGKPVVGHRQGFGVVMNGTINTPQGPGANLDVVILAASDSAISIRVTVVTVDDLRDPAFSVADSILNSIEWPADAQ